MGALGDWDDWSDDEPDWWLKHPLHRPRNIRSGKTRPVSGIRAGQPK